MSAKSKVEKSVEVLTQKFVELENRISKLESKRFDFDTDLSAFYEDEGLKLKKGRKPRIRLEEYLERREYIINIVEWHWPELALVIKKARKSEDLRDKIVFPGINPHTSKFAMYPNDCLKELWAFVNSNRFRGNPRNMANAMAGLPEVSWKRSFDIGSMNPSPKLLHNRVIRDYMKRHHPERLKDLLKAKTQPEIKKALNKIRSKNRTILFLKKYPGQIMDMLEQGKSKIEQPNLPEAGDAK